MTPAEKKALEAAQQAWNAEYERMFDHYGRTIKKEDECISAANIASQRAYAQSLNADGVWISREDAEHICEILEAPEKPPSVAARLRAQLREERR